MNKASVWVAVLFCAVLDISPALAQANFGIPQGWWTRSRENFPDWPQDFKVEDGIVHRIAEGAVRIVFEGPRYIVTDETTFINLNVKDEDVEAFDGRLLTAEEFVGRIEAGEAPTRIRQFTRNSLPAIRALTNHFPIA